MDPLSVSDVSGKSDASVLFPLLPLTAATSRLKLQDISCTEGFVSGK
jgi:hypothetical protein